MKKELFLYLDRRLMLRIVWEKGNLLETVCFEPNLQKALDTWCSKGISEWVGFPDMPEMRTTGPAHPEFLSRLADYITRQAGYAVRLVYHPWERDEPVPEPDRPQLLENIAQAAGAMRDSYGVSPTLQEAVDALRVYEETWQKNSKTS